MNRYNWNWNNPPPPGTECDDSPDNKEEAGASSRVVEPEKVAPVDKKRVRSRSKSYDSRRRRKRSHSRDHRRKTRSRSRHRKKRFSSSRSRSRSANRHKYRKHNKRRTRSRSRKRTHRSRDRNRDRDRKSPKPSRRAEEKRRSKDQEKDVLVEEDMKIEEPDDEDPSLDEADQGPVPFKNDGSFLEMFKKMQEEQKATEESTEAKKPVIPTFGKRRGGKVLKTGMVAKVRNVEEDANTAQDPWSIYMQEVRRYKEVHCDDDSKTRPLVK